jgi:disulfide bond formation protein DsbB
MARHMAATADPAYRAGGFALVLALGAIATALLFEHLGGFAPCPLCLQQRYAYYAGIPLLFIGLALIAADSRRAAGFLFFAVSLGFLANACLGVYHAGVEWKLWLGPDTCAGAGSVTGNAGDLLKGLSETRVIRCDEAPWRLLGLSFAGWNVIASFLAFVAELQAAFAASSRAP